MKWSRVLPVMLIALGVMSVLCSCEGSDSSGPAYDSVSRYKNGQIRGVVRSGERSGALSGALVTALPYGITTTTDKDGAFKIDVTPGYCEQLVIEKEGYGTAYYPIGTVLPKEDFEKECYLEKKPTAVYKYQSFEIVKRDDFSDVMLLKLIGTLPTGYLGSGVFGCASNALLTFYASEEGYQKGEVIQQVLSSEDNIPYLARKWSVPILISQIQSYKKGATLYVTVNAANIVEARYSGEVNRGCYIDKMGELHYTAIGPTSDLITIKIPD